MLTVLLAKILGLYLLIMGLAIFANRRHLMLAVISLFKERGAQLLGGVMALIIGLLIVNVHNDWSTLPASLISLFAWIAVIKGLVFLFLPEAKLQKFITMFSDRSWYMLDGAIAVLLGAYLAGFGFGWL